MWKRTSSERRVAIVFSVAASAMMGSAISVAGPGCMNNPQHMVGGYHAYGPIGPQAAYRPGPPSAYRAAPAPYRAMMAPPYQRPLPAQQGYYPAGTARAAAPAPVDTDRADSGLQAVSNKSEPAAENVTVRINGMRFEPSNITVKPGTTVTWVHGSSMPHTVTGNADGLRSSTLNSGQQFSHTFNATGRYDYSCDFHPSMKGSVIVEGMDT